MTQDGETPVRPDDDLMQVPHNFVWCDKNECVCFWPACWAHGCMAIADGELKAPGGKE